MIASELYDLFRSDVVDVAKPYLWTDTEVFAYMNDAYRQFVRLTGGVADSSSDLTQIAIVTGEQYAAVSPLILHFREAYLVSSGKEIVIANQEDAHKFRREDYGNTRTIIHDTTRGPVRYMVIGKERMKVQWVQVPATDDVAQLSVYRLPLDTITEGSDTFDFPDIGDEHVEWLMHWMKHRAYGKQDAETFDKGRSDMYKASFNAYCSDAKAEWERYKHKARAVTYGGL